MEKIIIALFFGYLILFPFGQLAKLPISAIGGPTFGGQLIKAPEVNLYLTDILVGLLVVFWLGWHFFKKEKIKLPPLAKPIGLFALIAGLSLLFNVSRLSAMEVTVSGFYWIRWIVYAGLYFVIFDLQKRFTQLKWQNLINYLIALGVVLAIFGLSQYILWPDLGALEALEWDPHYYRVVSTFLDPGFTGLILVLTLILLVCIYWQKFLKINSLFIIHYSLFIIIYLALALTYSRASYLAYLVGMGIIAWVKKAPKFFLVILLLGVVTLLVIPQPAGEGGKLARRYSIEVRIENWKQSLLIAGDHPLLGVGFNAYRYAQRDYGFLKKDEWQVSHAGAGADSSLLFVLATTGVFGFLAYLWLWARILLTSYFSVRTSPSERGLVIFSSSVAVLFHSWFLNSLFYPWIMAWMWILLTMESN